MPVSIILAASDEAKERALKAGFREEIVLIRHESVVSDDKTKRDRITSDVLHLIRPYQYALTDYWGMGNDD